MALSGSAQTTTYQYDSTNGSLGMIFSWSASQSVETNISTITWTLKTYGTQKATGGWYYTSGPLSMTLTASTGTISNLTKTSGNVAGSVSGNSWSFSGRQKLYGTGYSIAGGTFKLTHNTTGEASFKVSLSAAIYYSDTNCTGSGSFTLNSIPRATTPAFSLATIELGQAVTVDLSSRASSNFTHTLTYAFGSLSNQALGTAKTTASSFSFTFPTSLSAQMTDVGSKACTVTCKTFSGNTQIGTKTVTLTLTAPSSWLPGITTISCTPSNTVLGTNKYPATVTGVTVSVTCSTTNLHNATIANVAVTFQGKTYSTTTLSNNVATIATDVCTGSGSQTLVILVTDSRGRSVSDNTSINVIAYTNPTLTLEIKRTDGTNTNNTSEIGNYMYISYSGTVSTTGGLSNSINTASGKTPVLKYKKAGDSGYTTISLSPASGSTSYVYTSNIDTRNYNPEVQNTLTCEVVASITDLAGNTTTVTKTLAVGYKTLDFLAGGRGITLGGTSVNEGFVCNMDATFAGKIRRKNLLKNTHLLTEQTLTEVTYTPQSDGGILVNNTVAAAANRNAYYANSTFVGIPGHKYILSGCPAGGQVNSTDYYALYIARGSYAWYDKGNGVEFTYPSDVSNMSIIIRVYKNQVCSNKTFYPMIRDAGITDDMWEPYHMDVDELINSDVNWNGTINADNIVTPITYYPTITSSSTTTKDKDVGEFISSVYTKQGRNFFRVESKTTTINLQNYVSAGSSSGVYLIILRAWTTSLSSGAVYIVSYITNSYGAATCIESASNASLSISGTTVTITFADNNGGMVAIFGGPIV